MLNHGEYATPHGEDGSLRTKKPIMTYWALMVSFTLLGIHFFAARLPFLLAGCLTVWLTYVMSLKIFSNIKWALLAAALLGANFQFIVLCLRATPDILQMLFINLSLYGFISLIMNNDQRLRNFLFAYLGAALAVETKGLLGLTPVAYAFIYLFVSWLATSGKKNVAFRDIIHWPVIGIAVVMAVGWYAYTIVVHGEQALGAFFSDQVGDKLTTTAYDLFINFKDYLLGVFRNFMPWTFILPAGYIAYRKTIHPRLKPVAKPALFILGWFVVLLLIFIGSSDCRTRYLVPAYPLLSVLFAALFFIMFDLSGVRRLWKWFCILLFSFLTLTSLVLTAAGFIMGFRLIAAGAMLLILALVSLVVLLKRTHTFSPIGLAVVLLVATVNIRWLVLPAFEFAPSEKLTACLLNGTEPGQEISVWSTEKHNYTRQIYTLSKGRIRVHYFPRGRLPENLANRSLIILSQKELSALPSGFYTVRRCAYFFRAPPAELLWEALLNGPKAAVLTQIQKPIYVARRKPGTGNAS